MGKPFSVNTSRTDPFKNYRFKVYLGTSTTPVAGVSKISGMKRSSDVIDYKEGGNALIRKGLGRTKYDPITLERGVTFDTDFETWANAAQLLDQGPRPRRSRTCGGRFGSSFTTRAGRWRCSATSFTTPGFPSSSPSPI